MPRKPDKIAKTGKRRPRRAADSQPALFVEDPMHGRTVPAAPHEPVRACDAIARIKSVLDAMPAGDAVRVPIYNALTKLARDFVGMTEPCLAPQLVFAGEVHANAYNPNTVAPPEMALLHLSIQADGMTQAIVGYQVEPGKTEVVDGFHRNLVCRGEDRDGKPRPEWADIRQRLRGYQPIVYIDKPPDERKASTVRHNRARGKHGVGPMTELVREMFGVHGWSDSTIAQKLGMEPDEVLRLRQIAGLADLYADEAFSEAWDFVDDDQP